MIISPYEGFKGQHCETTATGSLLKHLGLDFSEPLIFGVGQGIGFIFWKMDIMNLPFIGGRSKPFELTTNFCRNMRLGLDARETGSRKKGWENIRQPIDEGMPVGVQLDCYYLEYFHNPIHFAGHFACVYGYDGDYAYLTDTDQQGRETKTSLTSLEEARFAKGSMAASARSWIISRGESLPALGDVISEAVSANALEFLNPPIRNFGYKGIEKAAGSMLSWLTDAEDPEADLGTLAMVMEKGGTGGGLFRKMYAAFLKEAQTFIKGNRNLEKGSDLFARAADHWTAIAAEIDAAGRSGEAAHLKEASRLCVSVAGMEKEAMERLSSL